MRYEEGGVVPPAATTIQNTSGSPERVYAIVDWFDGKPVVLSPDLPETTIFRAARVIVCGSMAHFDYTVRKAEIVLELRADLEKRLDAFAARFGVDRSTTSE